MPPLPEPWLLLEPPCKDREKPPPCIAKSRPPPLRIDRMDPAGEPGRERGDPGEEALRRKADCVCAVCVYVRELEKEWRRREEEGERRERGEREERERGERGEREKRERREREEKRREEKRREEKRREEKRREDKRREEEIEKREIERETKIARETLTFASAQRCRVLQDAVHE